MNTLPFSLKTKFLPQDTREDKIDLEVGGWEVVGIEAGTEHQFKQFLACPGAGSEAMAWEEKGQPLMHGWFFCRPPIKGKDRKKLSIRRQSLKHPTKNLRHQAPLCGGYCLFYRDRKPEPVTGASIHRAKLRLSLNLQRFIRHQPLRDALGSSYPYKHLPRLKERSGNRSFHGEEFSFDGEDNWLPDTPAWRQCEATISFESYLGVILKQVDGEIERACSVASGLAMLSDGWEQVKGWRGSESYSLSKVETLWEFPSSNPIGDVFEIGAKLMHLKKAGGSAAFYPFNHKQTGRVFNSPCFTIPIAEEVTLKLYAKTNQRIRFEIVQSDLMGQRSKLLEEAGVAFDPNSHCLDELPPILKALRIRAATHMNQVMEELRGGRHDPAVKACSLVDLLAEVSSAVPAPPLLEHKFRLGQIQTLLYFLCYQQGFRGNVKTGPYAPALATLVKRGVIKYDRPRQFYVLCPAYASAVDALVSSTGDPLLSFYTTDKGLCPRSMARLREDPSDG